MTNSKYLEKMKARRDTLMEDTENSIDGGNSVAYEEMKMEGRKVLALEIIAETLIDMNEKQVETLEKISEDLNTLTEMAVKWWNMKYGR